MLIHPSFSTIVNNFIDAFHNLQSVHADLNSTLNESQYHVYAKYFKYYAQYGKNYCLEAPSREKQWEIDRYLCKPYHVINNPKAAKQRWIKTISKNHGELLMWGYLMDLVGNNNPYEYIGDYDNYPELRDDKIMAAIKDLKSLQPHSIILAKVPEFRHYINAFTAAYQKLTNARIDFYYKMMSIPGNDRLNKSFDTTTLRGRELTYWGMVQNNLVILAQLKPNSKLSHSGIDGRIMDELKHIIKIDDYVYSD